VKDHAFLEDEHYMEGYFHGGRSREPVASLKPRDGQWMDKPAAPPRVRAFVQAIKGKNASLLASLAEALPSDGAMRRLLEEDGALMDIAIQVKYGSEVAGIHLAYHVDTFNSMLHLGVALAGCRTLYANHLTEEGATVKCASELPPGSVYLSSPVAFQHAVGHGKLARERRVVAVQCRVLMTPTDYKQLRAEEDGVPGDLAALAEVLEREELELPSLQEVQDMMKHIEM
jgi:hypothetical protein